MMRAQATMSWRGPFGITLIALFLGSIGCGGGSGVLVRTNGVSVDQQLWSEAKVEITRRASFDFQCNGPFHWILLTTDATDVTPLQVGVAGCGKRAVYTNLNPDNAISGWGESWGVGQIQSVSKADGAS